MPVGKTRNNENPKNDTLQQMAIILNTLDLRTEYEIFPMDEEVSEGPFLHDNFPSIHKSHVHGMLTDLGLLVPRLGDLVPQTQFSEMKRLIQETYPDIELKINVTFPRALPGKKRIRFYYICLEKMGTYSLDAEEIDYRKCRSLKNAYFKKKSAEKSRYEESARKKLLQKCKKSAPNPNLLSPTSHQQSDPKSNKFVSPLDKTNMSGATSISGKRLHVEDIFDEQIIEHLQHEDPTLYILQMEALLGALLRSIESFSKHNEIFVPRVNGTSALVLFIPSFSNEKSFKEWNSASQNITHLVEQLGMKNPINIDTGEASGANYVLGILKKQYPNTFKQHAMKAKISRMTSIETAAMLKDCGVQDKAICVKVHRHLKCKHGVDFFCPQSELRDLTCDKPTFTMHPQFQFYKEEGKKPEIVEYASSSLQDIITADLDRYLGEQYISDLLTNNNEMPLFGYTTVKNHHSIYAHFGTDHGAGRSQFGIKLNLEPSAKRREHGNEYGTRIITFGNIKCRKDTSQILKLLAPEVNEGVDALDKSKLIAIIDKDQKYIKTYFIPSTSRDVRTHDGKLFYYVNNEEHQITLLDKFGINLALRIIIPSFCCLAVGDLAAQVALQGRDSCSPHRCYKCCLKASEWKRGEEGYLLTLQHLIDAANNADMNTISQKEMPIWLLCPQRGVFPILHVSMGTVNNQLRKLIDYALYLDCGTNEESDLRLQIEQLKQRIVNSELNVSQIQEYYDSQMFITTEEKKELQKKLLSEKGKLRRRLKKLHDLGDGTSPTHLVISNDITGITANIRRLEHDVQEKNDDLKCFQESKKNGEDDLADLRRTLRESIANMKRLVNERRNDDTSLESEIERILTSHSVPIQVYHGGTLTGVACKRLLQNAKVIMHDIEIAIICCLERLRNANSPIPIPSNEDVVGTLKMHTQLFILQDHVYSHLRIIDPKEDELRRTKELIADMAKMWRHMKLPETHKAHLLFAHASKDQRILGGFGDKDEEWVEKLHQSQKIMSHLLQRQVGGYSKQMVTQFNLNWRNTMPAVEAQLTFVNTTLQRQNKRKLKEERDVERKKARVDLREENLILVKNELQMVD